MRMHRRYTSFHHTIHNFRTCICIHTRAFDNHNAKTRHEENTSQSKLAHRSMTMIIALVIITVDTIMHNQVSIVINVIIISFQLSSSTEAAAAGKLSSQINLHPHRHRHKQHQSHHSFIITITAVTTITFKKHW